MVSGLETSAILDYCVQITDDRIRVEFHVSLLWHALSAVDASNSLRQVPPYVLQVHRLDTVRVMRTATHGNQHCALQ